MINLQKKLKFAIKGKNLLNIKREQLLFYIDQYWNEYITLKKQFYELWITSYKKLNLTYKGMGKRYITLISALSRIQYDFRINIKVIKNLGLITSKIDYEFDEHEKFPSYSFENTSYHLDDLVNVLKSVIKNIMRLAEIEDLMIKFGLDLKKLNRRINALERKIIPGIQVDIKKIKDVLEENERESFSRLKKIKELINSST